MAAHFQHGRVDSLFDHVNEEWWKNSFDEMYLRTDGDCVEDPFLTEYECNEILNVSGVQKLFHSTHRKSYENGEIKTRRGPVQVLDLCCGQGRHSINLAKRYPSVNFYGLDQSTYLLDLAKRRSSAENLANARFIEADARRIPAKGASFDLVMVMGNSFGYCNDEDNMAVLKEISRVVKPGGIVIIDHMNGADTINNFSPNDWEWIDGSPSGFDAEADEMDQSAKPWKLLACRERELSADRKFMASREIVIDLDGSVRQDFFYSVRLYDLEEMTHLLDHAGLEIQIQDVKYLSEFSADGTGELRMMESRQFIVARKSIPEIKRESQRATGPKDNIYIHPGLMLDNEPRKGRCLTASTIIPAGTVLIRDAPYAIVPTVDQFRGDPMICSNRTCSRHVLPNTGVHCPRNCIQDVVWCDKNCQASGQVYHDLECSWLLENGNLIRQRESEQDFGMLWVVVRVLARRYLEILGEKSMTSERYSWGHELNSGWDCFKRCSENEYLWSKAQIEHWERLALNYLSDSSLLPGILVGYEDTMSLIRKEQTNSLGLYFRATGPLIPGHAPICRGESYARGIYPRAAMFNHSCVPNVMFKADGNGQIVFTAARDIFEHEECLITYFDLAEYMSTDDRQRMLRDSLRFSCTCERCMRDEF